MYYFILSVLPFFPLVAGIVSFIALIHLGENKPKMERIMLVFQAIVWLLFGVALTVLIYSIFFGMDYEMSEDVGLRWDIVSNISFFACIALPLVSLVIYALMISYRRNHPDEYKKNIQPVFVIGLPPFDHDDHESEDPAQPESTVTDQPENQPLEQEQPAPKVEPDQPESV